MKQFGLEGRKHNILIFGKSQKCVDASTLVVN